MIRKAGIKKTGYSATNILLYHGWTCKLVQPVWKTAQHYQPTFKACLPPSNFIPICKSNWKALFNESPVQGCS